MKCPLCAVDLVMSDRQGIEIDYCPKCRGIWLDRGEIDKIIERSQAAEAPRTAPEPRHAPAAAPAMPPAASGWTGYAPQPTSAGYAPPPRAAEQWRRDDDDDRHRHGHHGKKKKGFLSEILDFD